MSDLSREELKSVVQEVLDEARPRQVVIRETVQACLTELGVDHGDPMEMQKDFQHLREWRITMEQARTKGVVATVGFVVAGLIALIWMGMKSFFPTG